MPINAEPKAQPAASYRPVQRVVRGLETADGDGVRLTRLIGQPALPDLDPFLLLDIFGTDEPRDYIGGFPDHPHRGFETVTYMLEGRMRHRDNHGNEGLLVPGSVQWMTAGRGLVHSEMPEQQEGRMRGFQLWINLPAADKMTAPRYQEFAPDALPVVDAGHGISVKVIAGAFNGVTGPISQPATTPMYLDCHIPAGATLDLPIPAGHSAFVAVHEGEIRIAAPGQKGSASFLSATSSQDSPSASRKVALTPFEPTPFEAGATLSSGGVAVLGDGGTVRLAGRGDAGGRAIMVAGRPLGEPVARYGPFVMNSREEIQQAVEDYRAGRF